MGLIHKTKFVPFIDISKTLSADWKRIKKSTTYSLAFNPQTKTFDFISSDNPEEEIDSYQPALSQSITMYDDEPDFKTFFNMGFHCATGADAHRPALLAFYAVFHDVSVYAASEDTVVDETKTYYTRSGTAGHYVYTVVEEPTGNPSTSSYYELTSNTRYYKAWKVDSVVKLGTIDSVAQTLDFDLALNKHTVGAVTVNGEGEPTWVNGSWSGTDWADETFTPSA